MEDKLAAYRRRKRQKEILTNLKNKFVAMLPFVGNKDEKKEKVDFVIEKMPDPEPPKSPVPSDTITDSFSEDDDEPDAEDADSTGNKFLKYALWALYFLFWATCYAIAIQLKFGIVYLLFSGLFGMYFNTRTRPRRKHEMSAYSVFNQGCESIDGTLKAEQFEREIRYGPTSVR